MNSAPLFAAKIAALLLKNSKEDRVFFYCLVCRRIHPPVDLKITDWTSWVVLVSSGLLYTGILVGLITGLWLHWMTLAPIIAAVTTYFFVTQYQCWRLQKFVWIFKFCPHSVAMFLLSYEDAQFTVSNEIEKRRRFAVYLFQEEEEVCRTGTLRGKRVCIEGIRQSVRDAKKAFWEARNIAKSFGYKVPAKIGESALATA